VARKRSSTKPRKTVRKSSTKPRRRSVKKGVSKTFIILKSAKVSSKPLSKQGKKTVTKGTYTHLAVKVALKALKGGKRVKHVFLARKGKVMIFAIKFKAVAGKVKSICAKRIRIVDLKGTSAGAPHQSCLKSGLKRKTGLRKRRTVRKSGLRKRRTVRKTGLRKRRTVRKSGTKRKSVRKPRKRTTRKSVRKPRKRTTRKRTTKK